MNRAHNFILSSEVISRFIGRTLDTLFRRYLWLRHAATTRRSKVAASSCARDPTSTRVGGYNGFPWSETIEKIRRFIYPGLHGCPIADSRSFHAGNKHSSGSTGVKCVRLPAKSIHPTYLSGILEDLLSPLSPSLSKIRWQFRNSVDIYCCSADDVSHPLVEPDFRPVSTWCRRLWIYRRLHSRCFVLR